MPHLIAFNLTQPPIPSLKQALYSTFFFLLILSRLFKTANLIANGYFKNDFGHGILIRWLPRWKLNNDQKKGFFF